MDPLGILHCTSPNRGFHKLDEIDNGVFHKLSISKFNKLGKLAKNFDDQQFERSSTNFQNHW